MALREGNSALHWAATRPDHTTAPTAVAVGHFVQVVQVEAPFREARKPAAVPAPLWFKRYELRPNGCRTKAGRQPDRSRTSAGRMPDVGRIETSRGEGRPRQLKRHHP